jgi:hypothetical protein
MTFPWKKTKLLTTNEQREHLGLEPIEDQDAEEVKKMEESKLYALFEEAAEAILDHETCLTSPIDGNPMSFVRTTDALNALAEAMGVDIRQTGYEHFAK